MSGFSFPTNPSSSSSQSPFSFASSSSSSSSPFPSNPSLSSSSSPSSSPFGDPSLPSSTIPSFGFGLANSSSSSSAPSLPFGFVSSSAASSPLFGAPSAGASSSTFGSSTLFGSSSGSGSGSTSNVFGSSSGLFGSNSGSGSTSNFFGSSSGSFFGIRNCNFYWCSDTLLFDGSVDEQEVFLVKVGDEDVNEGQWEGEGEQMTDTVIGSSIVKVSDIQDNSKGFFGGQDQNAKRCILKVEGPCVQENLEIPSCATASFVTKQDGPAVESNLVSAVEATLDTTNTHDAPGKEVVCEVDSVEEVGTRDVVGAPEVSSRKSVLFPLVGTNEFSASSRNNLIIIQIFGKYGDITTGSILKSTAAKSIFLEFVADIVDRLCNHTLETLCCDELQLIKTRLDDAVAVGFQVDWLQHRVDKIIAASKYHARLMQLNELGQQIDAAKRSLGEMELRQMVWKKEIASMKVEIERSNFSESNLGEGLL